MESGESDTRVETEKRQKHERAVKEQAQKLEAGDHQILFLDVKPCKRPDIITYKEGKIYFYDAKARNRWRSLILEKVIELN